MLRAFVYQWLDEYVRGNGAIGATELENCIARMDERFDLLFDSPLQRKLYRVWRDDESNQLRFLMVSPRLERGGVAEQSHAPEPAARPVLNDRSSPSAR